MFPIIFKTCKYRFDQLQSTDFRQDGELPS